MDAHHHDPLRSSDADVPDIARLVASPTGPAEMIARAQLAMASVPRDVLLLDGCGPDHTAVITATPLQHVLTPGGLEGVERHLHDMQERGVHCADALILLDDGREEVPDHLLDGLAITLASRILVAADRLLPERFGLPDIWIVGGGTARLVVLGEQDAQGVDLLVSPTVPLPAIEETITAADAVLDGTPLPADTDRNRERLADLGRHHAARGLLKGPSRSHEAVGGDRQDATRIIDGLNAVREVLRRWSQQEPADASMTECERVQTWINLLAHLPHPGALIDELPSREEDRSDVSEHLLSRIVSDASFIPHPDVMPGGRCFEVLEQTEGLLDGMLQAGEDDAVLSAWCTTVETLAILAWWSHRYAQAGRFADHRLAHDREDPLALLLAAVVCGPDVPAWWPGGSSPEP